MSIEQGPPGRPGRWAHRYPESLPLEVWNTRETRLALATRDIATVYKLLQKHGVSQRRIAAFTQQSQGEISEIIAGRRAVTSYDLAPNSNIWVALKANRRSVTIVRRWQS
jgi:hypothetical protein